MSDSRDDTFASEALTGQFPILSVAESDPASSSPFIPAPPPPPPPPFALSSEKKPEKMLISDQTISQAAERLTAELRASLAFFNGDERETTQEDPASMINEILDIIGGNEQQDISQATLSAILDQTLHHLQGSTSRDSAPAISSPASSSIQENFTPASLEAYSSSVQIQVHEPPVAQNSTSESHPSIGQATELRGPLATPPSQAAEEDVFEEMFRQAMTTYLRRQYKEALQLFQECLLLRPDDPRTLYNVERLRKRIPTD